MKLLEDSFSYANQLGARQGAGAVYLNAHHPDIMRFLDTKRENADEKIRIKTLSLGVVVPDITFELAKNGEDMYLFSPYDVEKVYGVPFGDISVTEKYREMVDDAAHQEDQDQRARVLPDARRDPVRVRLPVHHVRRHGEPGEPDQGPDQHVEPVQRDPAGEHADDLQRGPLVQAEIGKDISCNLGSMNIALSMDGGDLGQTVETAIRALSAVSEQSHIASVRSIEDGNDRSHAIGLGQMNLHGYLAREHVHYGSEEGLDFTNIYFYTVLFHALRASNHIAIERGQAVRRVRGLDVRVAASSSTSTSTGVGARRPRRSRSCSRGMHIPTQEDWTALKASDPAARHLQPEPAGRAADRLDLVHQQLDVVDPPDRVEDRDPQGRQARSRLLPGAVHDERQPRVLPGRLRDRLREGHRHVRRGHAARRPGPVADAVLQGHRVRRATSTRRRSTPGARASRRSTTSACGRWRSRARTCPSASRCML